MTEFGEPGDRQLGPHPAPGDLVGPYTLGDILGAGGMASVYKARDADGQVIALKILNPARVLPEEVKRFTREYQALARMDHKNIVRVFGAGVSHGGYPWIAMEYVDGADLGTHISRWQQNPPPDRFERIEQLLRGLAAGLQYVHDLGLIHRDIKPNNILVTRTGEAKLSDFGVVKDPNAAGTQLTMAGRLVGTVAFMAPELISGDDVDRRADLYALGAVLYMLLTYRRPIEASSVAGYLARHLTEVPMAPGDVDPAIPARLERICQRLLKKDPSHRYPNARAVLVALDRTGHEEPPVRGRERVISRFDARMTKLLAGAGGALGVIGPEGSGKSRVLDALVELARSRDVRVGRASGSFGDPMAQLAMSMGIRTRAAERTEAVAAKISEKPTVLAIDDLDEAQRAQVDALTALVRDKVTMQGQPVLLLFTAQHLDDVLAPLMMGVALDLPPETLELGPLDAKAIVALVRDHGLTGAAAPVLGRRLHAVFEGMAGPVIQQLETLVSEGWLTRLDDHTLKASRPMVEFRKGELPVPRTLQASIEASLEQLDPYGAEIVDLLAVLQRPASTNLLCACAADDDNASRAIADLLRTGLLRTVQTETLEVIDFSNPCAGPVVRAALADPVRRAHHAAIAKALGRRRRRSQSPLELAHHLLEAGDPDAAYPLFVQACRRAARAKDYAMVLEAAERAHLIRNDCEPQLDPSEAAKLRRWTWLLEGEARLARGQWSKAIPALEEAVAAARLHDDQGQLARCLGSLGRAHYRNARFDVAEPLLREALEVADPGAPERASATRALADIQLRIGDTENAERLWEEALDLAIEGGSQDGEARARRGLAHSRVLQGRLIEASDLLERADELLAADGDPRVRAGVLARAIELDIVAGRFGAARHRSATLLDLARNHELAERLATVHALTAELQWTVGDWDRADESARQAVLFARAAGPGGWDARLRAARVFAGLDAWDEMEDALPNPEALPDTRVDNPKEQYAALRARVVARSNPARGGDLAMWALVRPAALLGIRNARIMLDVSHALTTAHQTARARDAAKRGLKALHGPGADGLRVELMLALNAAAPDPRVVAAARQVAERIRDGLHRDLAEQFEGRPGIAEVMR